MSSAADQSTLKIVALPTQLYPHKISNYRIEQGSITKAGVMKFGGVQKVTAVISGVNCYPGGPIRPQDDGFAPIIFTLNRPDTNNLIILGVPHRGDIGYHFDPANPNYPLCECDQANMGVTANEWEEKMRPRCQAGVDWTYTMEITSATKSTVTLAVPGYPDLVRDYGVSPPSTMTDYFSDDVDIYIGDFWDQTKIWMALDHPNRLPRGLYGATIKSLVFE